MLRMPVELIARILFLACQGGFVEYRGDSALPHSLLSVSSVCAHWREIALSTQKIWTSINMTPSTRRRRADLASNSSRIQAHLERSGSTSFDLLAHLSLFPSLAEQQFTWRLISSHLHRARSIELYRLTPEFAASILPFPMSGPARLRQLHLSSNGQPFFVGHVLQDANAAPNLFDISLNRILTTNTPFGSLTRLTLKNTHSMPWTYVLACLEPRPNLEHVQLHFEILDADADLRPVVLPNLISLVVHDSPFDRYLKNPKLEHLGCTGFRGKTDFAHLPTLKRLSLYHPSRRALKGWAPSRNFLTLQTLKLVQCKVVDVIIDLLLRSDAANTPPVFPMLEKCRSDGAGYLKRLQPIWA